MSAHASQQPSRIVNVVLADDLSTLSRRLQVFESEAFHAHSKLEADARESGLGVCPRPGSICFGWPLCGRCCADDIRRRPRLVHASQVRMRAGGTPF